MPVCKVNLVLHAHLPFVNHPDYENFLEERWFFEAISETYLPLLRAFSRLEKDNIPFRLTMSFSASLLNMFRNKDLQRKYIKFLENLQELGNKELQRCKNNPEIINVVKSYMEIIESNISDFKKYENDISIGFKYFQDKGYLELITTTATHVFLPFYYKEYKNFCHVQINEAIRNHIDFFGKEPNGLWLPECGYDIGLEKILENFNIKYCFLETHATLLGKPTPVNSVYEPIKIKNSNVFAFSRDPSASEAVWSSKTGYPGNINYREYYRDIGFDLDIDYLKKYMNEDDIRIPTGFKYYSISGSENKWLYNLEKASEQVYKDALDFLENRIKETQKISPNLTNREVPVFTAPYDAELFGHWWFEGTSWIENVFRVNYEKNMGVEFTTPTDIINDSKDFQEVQPVLSSWGKNGYGDIWLDGSNSWIYNHYFECLDRLESICGWFIHQASPIQTRIINQMIREVFLAISSDWAFIIRTETTISYAKNRIMYHLNNFFKLSDDLINKDSKLDLFFLSDLEHKNCILPNLNFKNYINLKK